MSEGVHCFKVMLNERLAVMAREISELFDGMIAQHVGEIRVLKVRNKRQQRILDSVLKPRVVLHRTDIQILSDLQGEVDTQMAQGRTSEPPHIKEEHLDFKQEQGEPQEFTCTLLTIKSEDEENKPPALHLSPPEEQKVVVRSDPQPHAHSDTENSFELKDKKEKTDDLTVSSTSPDRSSGNVSSDKDAQAQDSSDTDDSQDWGPEPPSGGHNSHGRSNKSVNDNKEVIFECPKCLKTFLHKGQTPANHSKRKGLTCVRCSVGSKRQGKCHMKSNGVKKTFTCEVCEKGFTREDNLKTHMLIHKGVRPHTCTVCKKSFTESGHLKAHVRTHTGEKPFSCSICKKCFTHRATRDRHERNHSGDRPYTCSECGTEFKQKAHYLSHLRVHSRERPYSCPVCNKTYSRNSHVTSHMKVHTRKPIQCT